MTGASEYHSGDSDRTKLKLVLPEGKTVIIKYFQGLEFLGFKIFPRHILLRTKTKRRIMKKMEMKQGELKGGKIDEVSFEQSRQSYLGILRWCCGHGLKQSMRNI